METYINIVMERGAQYDKALKYARQIAYSSEEVLTFSYDMAVKYRDSPGVYCECGVAAGAQIIMMAAGAPDKTIYAFDSFEGIPLPSNRDNQMPGVRFLKDWEQKALPDPGKQVLETTGATAVSHESFETHILTGVENPERIISLKGWFEETMPRIGKVMHFAPMDGISILRLDGDLYNSTYVCLKYLYPRMLEGGLVIVDDWALPGCMAAVIEYFSEQLIAIDELNMKFITEKTSEVAYWTV